MSRTPADRALRPGPIAIVRNIAAGLSLALLTLVILRNGAVGAWSVSNPSLAARWWPGHPTAELSLAEAAIGRLAARGQEPDSDTLARLALVARRAPLATQPVVVQAVTAQQAGDDRRAERLFVIAEQRDGRELAPHLFLADLYLRSGRLAHGLREVVNLARLAPNGIASAAPFVATYARDPVHWGEIRAVLQREPTLGTAVLVALAADPANVPALLALASGKDRSSDAPWVGRALGAQVAAGRYAEAHALWARMSGVDEGPGVLVHDPDFRDARSPAPFNWSLEQSAIGLVERRGGLHVTYYGTQSGSLARQLLLLAPGRYRLSVASEGKLAEPQALRWTISCATATSPLAQLPVRPGSTGAIEFTVAAGCPAQWLSLDGREQDISADSDIRVRSIKLERLGG